MAVTNIRGEITTGWLTVGFVQLFFVLEVSTYSYKMVILFRNKGHRNEVLVKVCEALLALPDLDGQKISEKSSTKSVLKSKVLS